jgi:hypothetical protein
MIFLQSLELQICHVIVYLHLDLTNLTSTEINLSAIYIILCKNVSCPFIVFGIFFRKKNCFLSSDVSTESLEMKFGMALTFNLCFNINNVLMLIRVKCRFKLKYSL